MEEKFLKEALKEARRAYEEGEVPVGCVLVREGKILSRARNRVEREKNPLRHAEIVALEKALKETGEKYLYGCTLYVTLEPCVMCSYALVLARVERVVFMALDEKHGGVMSLFSILDEPLLNHRVRWEYRPLEEASALLRTFFRERRKE